jgi:hypothetical protein
MERERPKRQLKRAIFGNPGLNSPAELNNIISSDGVEKIIINNCKTKLVISGEAIKDIASMNPNLKAYLMTRILNVIQEKDTRTLEIHYGKSEPFAYRTMVLF